MATSNKANFTVYMHVAPNGKKYIGITSQKPNRRWHAGHGYKGNTYFSRAIIKYGWDNFEHIILAENLTEAAAAELEKFYIRKYDTTNKKRGFNHSIGGECHTLGYKMSDEVKEKHRKSMIGRTFSKETRKLWSEQRKGRPAWNKGRKLSQEHLQKLCTPVICVETKITYFGLSEAARQLGIHEQNICKCLKGERERAGGFHWKKCDNKKEVNYEN